MKLCALSVDLDEVPCYHAIHGLRPPRDASAHAVYQRAVPRFLDLFHVLGVRGTFFVIGRDLVHDAAVRGARALAEAGHELGNHSQNHRYDLVRLGLDEMRREVVNGADAIAAVTGARPVGFRAPGYTVTDDLFDVLLDAGVRYDSSVFPCPAYYLAKVGAITGIRLRGRRSHSVVDTPAVLAAPADPYVPGRPYWKHAPGGDDLVELPIGVTRRARLPFIGTSVMLAGRRGAELLASQIAGRPFVNLELHGMDLLDASDGLDALRPHQPDLRVTVEEKQATLRRVVRLLRAEGYELVTLAEAAEAFRKVLLPEGGRTSRVSMVSPVAGS